MVALFNLYLLYALILPGIGIYGKVIAKLQDKDELFAIQINQESYILCNIVYALTVYHLYMYMCVFVVHVLT